jgi:hypothetical protein
MNDASRESLIAAAALPSAKDKRVMYVEFWRERELAQRNLTWPQWRERWEQEDKARARDDEARPGREKAQRKKEEDRIAGARLAILLTMAVGTLLLATYLAYRFIIHKSPAETWDFACYALPAMAALVAGLSAYIKKYELQWFWVSSFLVIAGLVVYLRSKGIDTTLVWCWLISYGAAVALFLGSVAWRMGTKEGKVRATGRFATLGVSLLLFIAVGFDLYASRGSPTAAFNNLMKYFAIPSATSATPEESEVVCRVTHSDASSQTLLCRRE